MRYVLGLDGGGTKTDCVLMDEQRVILSRSAGGPSNPMRVGFGGALASICEAACDAAQSARIPADAIGAICAGLAGTAQPDAESKMKRLLEEEFPPKRVRVCTDLDLTLAAAGEAATIVLIAGTGSAAVGRDQEGRIARVGGRGSLLSDEGSAYDIGRRASMLAIQEFDRTAENSALGARILREIHCATWQEFQNRSVALPDEVFPRIFPVVTRAADNGDAAARQILQKAAVDLSSLVSGLMERLRLQDKEFLLVCNGGMLGRSSFLDQQLGSRLREVAPRAEFGALVITPPEAAARMALQLLQPHSQEGISRG
jgi:N-acetylglucosamine kinase-like BadF-type ATPase